MVEGGWPIVGMDIGQVCLEFLTIHTREIHKNTYIIIGILNFCAKDMYMSQSGLNTKTQKNRPVQVGSSIMDKDGLC